MMNRVFFFLGIAVMLGSCAMPNGPDWRRSFDSGIDTAAIINYDLQAYIPIPTAGALPARTVNHADLYARAAWSVAVEDGFYAPFDGDSFAQDAMYRADITLEGNAFDPGVTFGYSKAAVANQSEALTDAGRSVTVTYNRTEPPVTIKTPLDLTDAISAPVWETVPAAFFGGDNYNGRASWKTAAGGAFTGAFRKGESYTARVSLYPAPGYVFTDSGKVVYKKEGITVEPETYTRARDGTVTVEIVFGEAGRAMVNDYDLTYKVPEPVGGNVPTAKFETPQYTGTIAWMVTGDGENLLKPEEGERFQGGVKYTAVVSMKALGEYFFPLGIAFTHKSDALGRSAGDGSTLKWTIDFPPAAEVVVTDLDLTYKVPEPVGGNVPTAKIETPQYTGTVAWTMTGDGKNPLKAGERFQGGAEYTATVTLTAKDGYVFPAGDVEVTHTGIAGEPKTRPFTRAEDGTVGGDLPFPKTIPFSATL
jgi:hypothetical protein